MRLRTEEARPINQELLTCEAIADRGLIERYVSGRLSDEPGRTELEAHLLMCAACRDEVRLAMVVRAELGAPQRRSWWWLGVGAAAAVLILLVARPTFRSRPDDTVERGTTEGLPVITALSPPLDAVVPPRAIRFLWHSVDHNVQYRLSLTNQRGDMLWSFETMDTTALLPADVRVQRGNPYFWYIDALLADGRSATSRVQRFTVVR